MAFKQEIITKLSRGANVSISAFVNTTLVWNRSMDCQSMKTTFYCFKLKTWQINLAQYKYKRQSTIDIFFLLIFRSWNQSTTITDWFTNIWPRKRNGHNDVAMYIFWFKRCSCHDVICIWGHLKPTLRTHQFPVIQHSLNPIRRCVDAACGKSASKISIPC